MLKINCFQGWLVRRWSAGCISGMACPADFPVTSSSSSLGLTQMTKSMARSCTSKCNASSLCRPINVNVTESEWCRTVADNCVHKAKCADV